MSDGRLIFDTKLDDSGITSGLKGLSGKIGGIAGGIAKGIAVATTAVVGLATGAVKSGIEFESAFAGVRKTVDTSEENFEKLRQSILGMSTQMPQSATEIAGVMEAAGQLGIQLGKDNQTIIGFTDTMLKLGDATNLTSEQAATSLARFANVTQMPQENFDRLGSTIVELGNNMATTEAEIVEMGMRLAGTGTQVGLTEANIMALAGTMSSLGINAEAGGSAMSRSMQKINTAVLSSTEELKGFASVAGMTAEEFSETWRTSPIEAIDAFAKGLNKVKEEGGDVTQTLKDLGITSVQEIDTWNRLANSGDLLAEAVEMANRAWEENIALTMEAEAKWATTESALLMLKNSFLALGIALFDVVKPQINEAILAIRDEIVGLKEAFEEGGFEQLSERLGQSLADGLTQISTMLPQFVQIGIDVIQNLIQGISDNAPQLVEAGMSLITTLIEGIGTIAVSFLDLGLQLVTELINGINDGGSELLSVMGDIFEQLKNVLIERLPELLEAGAELVKNIGQGILDNAPTLIEQAGTLITNFINGFSERLPELLQLGIEILGAIGQGILENLPLIFEQVGQIMQAFLQAVLENLPSILQAGAQLIVMLIQGIVEGIPKIIEAGNEAAKGLQQSIEEYDWASLGKSVIEFIVTAIKGAISGLITLGGELVSAIAEGISGKKDEAVKKAEEVAKDAKEKISSKKEDFKVAGQELIDKIKNGFDNKKESVINAANTIITEAKNKIESFKSIFQNAGKSLIDSVKQGFDNAKSAVINSANTIINEAKNKIESYRSQLQSVGTNLINSLKSGFDEAKGNVVSTAQDIVNSAKSAMQELASNFTSVGSAIVQGVASGITHGIGSVISAAQDMAQRALSAAKRALGISSPSKVFRDQIGLETVRGFALGIDSNTGLVTDSMSALSKELINKAKNTIDEVNNGFNIKGTIAANGITSSGQDNTNDSNEMTINLYGVDYNDRSAARGYGKELGNEVKRELRRRGL